MPHPHTSIAPYPQPGDSSPHKTQSQDSLALPTHSSSGSDSTSSLQLLDNDLDEPDDDVDLDLDDMDLDDEESDARVDDPLVRGRAGRRRGRRYKEEATERGLLEVSTLSDRAWVALTRVRLQLIPPLMLSHPLPLLPLLALLPYNFLPAGVVFFVPVICILALLSVCAHIVIVYLAWCVHNPFIQFELIVRWDIGILKCLRLKMYLQKLLINTESMDCGVVESRPSLQSSGCSWAGLEVGNRPLYNSVL